MRCATALGSARRSTLTDCVQVLESIFPDELESGSRAREYESELMRCTEVDENEVRIRVEPEEEVTGHPCESRGVQRRAWSSSITASSAVALLVAPQSHRLVQLPPNACPNTSPVTLTLVVTYPPTYPDVVPDMALEEIDEELGELRDGEEDAILAQLREVVRSEV